MSLGVPQGGLKFFAQSCVATAFCATLCVSQPSDFHGPPWNGPVASSAIIHLSGGSVQVDFGPGDLDLRHDEVLGWVNTAGKAIAGYYGQFPVTRARILVVPVAASRGILMGTTWGDVGGFPAFTRIELGQHTTAEDLLNDWTMTHELTHMAFPSLSDEHHWLEEGLATYVEPIARAQIGTLTPKQIWKDMRRDMRKGEPGASDVGLDRTHSWASTYWGGALFCLVGDVRIRQETGNRKGLQDALRAILSAGGTIDHNWPISKVLAVGDQATGTSVLTVLYKDMGEKSEFVDLDDLWKQLGIGIENGNIVFDDAAPLARIRERITSPDHPPTGNEIKAVQ
jgi:hypothetical protein